MIRKISYLTKVPLETSLRLPTTLYTEKHSGGRQSRRGGAGLPLLLVPGHALWDWKGRLQAALTLAPSVSQLRVAEFVWDVFVSAE